jgi:hypothetical protein
VRGRGREKERERGVHWEALQDRVGLHQGVQIMLGLQQQVKPFSLVLYPSLSLLNYLEHALVGLSVVHAIVVESKVVNFVESLN